MGLFNRTKPSQYSAGSTAAKPGWYLDAAGSGQLRYWDGALWNEHYATAPDQQQPPRQESDAPASRAHREPAGDSRPFGRPVPPWSEKLGWQGIVGESFHEDAFKAIAVEYGQRTLPDYGFEVPEAVAAIVPDPDNKFDSNAVAVWVEGKHLVGHLPRDFAAQYAPRLGTLDRGAFLQVPARVWIGNRTDWDERTGAETQGVRGSVSVRLPEPDGIVAFNDLPDEPHAVLPWGRAVQITAEEQCMDVLRTFTLGSDPRHVAASLHVIEEPRRTGDPVRVIEVAPGRRPRRRDEQDHQRADPGPRDLRRRQRPHPGCTSDHQGLRPPCRGHRPRRPDQRGATEVARLGQGRVTAVAFGGVVRF
jgi:hypothetical protein